MNFFQAGDFLRFFRNSVTKYQLHSPFVFELVCAVLEDKRWFYAFRDVEGVRKKMLDSDLTVKVGLFVEGPDQGARIASKHQSVSSLARQCRITASVGQMLFRLTNHLKPQRILELGTSLGIGTMYLASAAREAQLLSLEPSYDLANIARVNLEILGLNKNVKGLEGDLERNQIIALKELVKPDFIFFNGHHAQEAILRYFESSLPFAHLKTVFVFQQTHRTKASVEAWTKIKAHGSVTLTLDFFELSLAFIDPDFREKQHFNVLPARWKPWMFF